MIFLSIDLQYGFSSANDPQIIQVAREEVKRAVKFNYGIIFLQYEKHGPTFSEIKSAANGYYKKKVVHKNSDDGAVEVLDAAFYEGFSTNIFRICGVYTELCVYDTVKSLTELSPSSNIIIRKDGCRCFDEGQRDELFTRLKNLNKDKVMII